jgi:3-oxoacyl-[acyl-carrier-protein] synthase II
MPNEIRIVVTGMGMVTPLGCGVETVWQRLLSGASGLRRLPDEFCGAIDAKVGALVPSVEEDPIAGFDLDRFVDGKDQKKMDRFIALSLAAADEALSQANWHPLSQTEKERTATVVASGIGGFPAIAHAVRTTDGRGPRRLSPFTIPSFLINLAAGHISIRHGFRGPIGAPVTACAASVQALGDGARLIRSGEADVVLCGGTESAMNLVTQGGFAAARALSTGFNDHPAEASRPFDSLRDGFVVGEGAGMLVLETLGHALARGATPLVELVGYGTTADAHHITTGPADGNGAARAMQLALRQAGIGAMQVQHVNAHATSTQLGDAGELTAIRSVFSEPERSGIQGPAISATKSATGHLLGAAGAVEAIFTVMALRRQTAPPTLNLHNPDPLSKGLDLVCLQSRPIEIEYALSSGFGFGGVNASVIFKRYTA